MTSIFQKRKSSDYGTAIVKYSAKDWDPETRIIYLMGRKPVKFEPKFREDPVWIDFLASKGATVDLPVEQLAKIASEELVSRIVDQAMIERIAANIIHQIETNPTRKFTSVRIASPFPLDETATNNAFAPALAAAVAAGLEALLPEILLENHFDNLEVIADLDPVKSSREYAILNIVDNQRGNTSTPEPGEEVATYMQRISRQPVYSGKVDPNAIYVPVDDFLVSQSTVVGLMNYIQANGAVTTSAVTGFKLFAGVEVLEPQPATLALLEMGIRDKAHEVAAVGGVDSYKAEINAILNRAGLNIGFEDISKTTLSNIELLFVAGYFCNGENPEHQQGFERAMAAINSNVDQARGNSSHDVFNSPSGSLSGLETIFDKVLDDRYMLEETTASRYQALIESGRITDFKEVINAR